MPDICKFEDDRIIVRQIRDNDAEVVTLLTEQLGYERSAEQVREWIAGLSVRPEQAAFVACSGGAVIGWIEVSIERRLQSSPFAMIGGLVISDGFRSRGIGRLLCKRVEEWAWDQGIDTVRVTSRSTRADAHRFYLRDGYHEVKTSLVFEKHKPAKTNRP